LVTRSPRRSVRRVRFTHLGGEAISAGVVGQRCRCVGDDPHPSALEQILMNLVVSESSFRPIAEREFQLRGPAERSVWVRIGVPEPDPEIWTRKPTEGE